MFYFCVCFEWQILLNTKCRISSCTTTIAHVGCSRRESCTPSSSFRMLAVSSGSELIVSMSIVHFFQPMSTKRATQNTCNQHSHTNNTRKHVVRINTSNRWYQQFLPTTNNRNSEKKTKKKQKKQMSTDSFSLSIIRRYYSIHICMIYIVKYLWKKTHVKRVNKTLLRHAIFFFVFLFLFVVVSLNDELSKSSIFFLDFQLVYQFTQPILISYTITVSALYNTFHTNHS